MQEQANLSYSLTINIYSPKDRPNIFCDSLKSGSYKICKLYLCLIVLPFVADNYLLENNSMC